MRIRRRDLEAVVAQGRAGYPFEVCGVLLGSGPPVRVARAVAVENRETEAPRVRYTIAPEDLIRIQREARGEGLDIVGYYHTHPDHPAWPSETDRRIAAEGLSDGVVHMVIGVAGGTETVPSAWVFRDDRQQFEAEPLDIEEVP